MEQTISLDTTWQVYEDTTGILGYKFGAVHYTGGSGEGVDSPILPFVVPSDTRDNYSHSIYVGADHSFRSDLTGSRPRGR